MEQPRIQLVHDAANGVSGRLAARLLSRAPGLDLVASEVTAVRT